MEEKHDEQGSGAPQTAPADGHAPQEQLADSAVTLPGLVDTTLEMAVTNEPLAAGQTEDTAPLNVADLPAEMAAATEPVAVGQLDNSTATGVTDFAGDDFNFDEWEFDDEEDE